MNDLISANPTAYGEIARRRRHGEFPLIAPKLILDTPLWLQPRKASATSHYLQRYTNLLGGVPIPCAVEVTNALPITGDASSGGVLRYLDLDVLMALSLAWTNAGCPSGPTAAIEIEMRDMLRWLGFGNLALAPYQELRSSLERLEFSTIAVWSGSDAPPPGIKPFRLIEGQTIREDSGAQGRPKIVNARLSDVWREALASIHDWQAVDIHAYAHLVHTNRRLGLARVLYLYLMCSRDSQDRFSVPYVMIRDRFAQRRKDGQILYANPMDQRGTLGKALKALHTSGVIQFDEQSNRPIHELRLEGRFVRTSSLALETKQKYFISPGMWDDTPRIVNDETEPREVEARAVEQPKPEENKQDILEERFRLLYEWLAKERGVTLSAKLIKQAQDIGTTWVHLANILLVADIRQVARPAGYCAAILRDLIADHALLDLWNLERAHEQTHDYAKSDFEKYADTMWKKRLKSLKDNRNQDGDERSDV